MAKPKSVAAALNRAQRERLATLLTTPAFQRFVLTIFEASGMDGSTFVQGSPDATSFMEGRRSLGIDIRLLLLGVDPEAAVILEQERLRWAREASQQIEGDPNADPYPDPYAPDDVEPER